ncbi:MAG: hypothetical protein AAF573_19735 [Bacteroidota bacterium]
MKTPKDDIFQLIQAMTAAEKRYFKIHFSSEQSLVTELFNYLNSLKSYDEEEVKKYFKATTLSKNLKVYKIMLMELLLKSLSSFRYKKSINSIIRQNLEEVEILTEKGLYTLAFKKLKKAKELCIQHEKLEHLVRIYHLEYQFKAFYEIKIRISSLQALDQSIAYSRSMMEIFKLKKINYELSTTAGDIFTLTERLEKIADYEKQLLNTLKEDHPDSDKISFHRLYYVNAALGHLYHYTEDTQKEHAHKKKIIDFFEDNPHFIESEPRKYWSSYFHFTDCCRRNNFLEAFQISLNTLKKFTNKHPLLRCKMILVYVVEMAYQYKQQNFTFIVGELEPTVLKEITTHGAHQQRSVIYSYIWLAITHLALGSHTQVQFYLRRLFKNKRMGEAFNYFYETVDMISHYESGDIDILKNLLTSKKRKIKRDANYGTPFFVKLLDFFTDLVEQKNDKAKSVKLLEASADNDDGLFRLMRYFLLEDWMKTLLEKKT